LGLGRVNENANALGTRGVKKKPQKLAKKRKRNKINCKSDKKKELR